MKRFQAYYVYDNQDICDYICDVIDRMKQYGEEINHDSIIDWIDMDELQEFAIEGVDLQSIIDNVIEDMLYGYNTMYASRNKKLIKSAQETVDEEVGEMIFEFTQEYCDSHYNILEYVRKVIENVTFEYVPTEPGVGIMDDYYASDMDENDIKDEVCRLIKEDFYSNSCFSKFQQAFAEYKKEHNILNNVQINVDNTDIQNGIEEWCYEACPTNREIADMLDDEMLQRYEYDEDDVPYDYD